MSDSCTNGSANKTCMYGCLCRSCQCVHCKGLRKRCKGSDNADDILDGKPFYLTGETIEPITYNAECTKLRGFSDDILKSCNDYINKELKE